MGEVGEVVKMGGEVKLEVRFDSVNSANLRTRRARESSCPRTSRRPSKKGERGGRASAGRGGLVIHPSLLVRPLSHISRAGTRTWT